jgi:hypothetical protein
MIQVVVAEKMAEKHATGTIHQHLVDALARRIPKAHNYVREQEWMTKLLRNRRVVITTSPNPQGNRV